MNKLCATVAHSRVGVWILTCGLLLFAALATNAATVTTDYLDYRPGGTVNITGAGFQAGEMVECIVEHLGPPLNTNQPAYQAWYVTANASGGFQTTWTVPMDPDVVGATFILTASGLSSGLQAGASFTDGNVGIDFTQFANEAGNLQWLNGTLNANNSTYTEGMSVPQRLILNDILPANPNCNGNVNYHCLKFKMLATKGGSHAYDFLTSWEQGVMAADQRIAPGLNLMAGLAASHCLDLGNPYAGICTTLHGPTNFFNVPITGDEVGNNVTLEGVTDDVGLRIQRYENLFGDRTARIYANAVVSNATFAFLGYEPGSGEIYSVYQLCWESTATQLILEVAGHLSQTTDEGQLLSYPNTGGSANISGGPYHFKLVELDCGSTGNQDNQIQGGEIMPQPRCVINISATNACAGSGITLVGSIMAGTAPFTYTWISPENNYTNIIVTNATSVAITVFNPGTYSLIISDANGLTSPDPCDTVITAIPSTVSSPLTNQALCAGLTAQFCTTASGGPNSGTGDFTFVWTKNGAPLSSLGDILITSTTNSSCLRISNVDATDTAIYCVQVTGQCNTVTNCATLTVSAQGPSITCAPPKNVECGSPLTFDPPTSSGAPVIIGTVTNASGFCGDTFSVTRTWRVVDNCGRTNQCSQTIIVVDTTPPSANCPTNKSVACGTAWTFDPPTASDICGTNSVALLTTLTNQVCGNTFSATRTWAVTDACGNAFQCGQTVTVFDNTPPEVNCVSNKVVQCGATWNFDEPNASDTCGTNAIRIVNTITNPACGNTFSVTRRWRITDACLNQAECLQTVTIIDTTAPDITCPTNLTVECLSGVPAPLPTNVTSDTCGSVTNLWAGDTRETNACIITITRTYRAIDACGNSNSCTQIITVADVTAPQISGVPGNLGVSCASAIPALPNVTANDNCLGAITPVHSGSTNGSCPMVIVRRWVASDLCGNATTNSYTITVNDTNAPSISGVPANLGVSCPSAIPALPNVTANDNCLGAITPVHSGSTNGSCPIIIVRRWVATDLCNNATTNSYTITVNDTNAPVITGCASNLTVECFANVPVVNTNLITATDDCGTVIRTHVGDQLSTNGCVITVTRTYRAADQCGNFSQCVQVITVADVTAPQISGVPANLGVTCPSAIPALPNVTANDNCLGAITPVHSGSTNGSCPIIIVRRWVASDLCGNAVTNQYTIMVNDTNAPVITGCASNLTVECFANVPVVNTNLITATDNCGTVIRTHVGDQLSTNGCVITVTRTYRAADQCGNFSQCVQVITVADVTAPQISGVPANLGVTCPSAIPALPNVTANDNCLGAITPVHSGSTNGSCPIIIVRRWVATDLCNNATTNSYTITVNDTNAPVITGCASNLTVECFANVPVVNTNLITATDDCGTVIRTHVGDQLSTNGCVITVTRTYRAADQCGNFSQCVQVITVADVTAPQISGVPANLGVTCPSAIPALPNVTANDNCLGAITPVHSGSTNGSCPIIIVRRWVASDLCGNAVTNQYTIMVNDTNAPVITGCASNLTVECFANVPVVNTNLITATDDCGTVIRTHVGDQLSTNGCVITVTRTYRAADQCGNFSQCVQVITVADVTAPQISGVPANLGVTCPSAIPALPNVTANDNCLGAITPVHSGSTNGSCPIIIVRRWVASDLCGNAVTNQYTITVNDTNAPSISGVPANLGVSCPSAIPALPVVTANDNCLGAITPVHSGSTNGSCPIIIVRRWVATDLCNNATTNSYTITVNDTNAPTVVVGTTDKTIECGTAWEFDPPQFTDNCGPGTVTVTNSTTTNAACGNTFAATRTWFARDLCNNLTTVAQTVTVRDTIPPGAICPTNKTVECTVPWTFDPPIPLPDACGTNRVDVIGGSTNGTCGNGFIATRIWRITDACTNFATCQQTVTVQDTTPPVITCPSNITVQCEAQIPSPDPLGIIASDTCGAVTNKLWERDTRVTNGCMITLTRTYRATDACGNQAQCQQTIIVLDTIPPVITCASNRTVECGQPWQFFPPSASDNCQLVSLTNILTLTNGGCGNTFAASRIWRALDNCGNATFCTNIVTVVDTTPPTALWAANRTNQCTQIVVFTAPTNLTDTCSSTYSVVVTVTNLVTTDGLNRLVQTRCWRIYDACSNYIEGCQSVTVENCAVEYCSLTQGAYGNSGGKFNGIPRPQLIQKLLTVPGTATNSWDLVLGKPGRSMRFTRDSVSCIIMRLPAGGPAAAFPAFGNATLLPDLCQTSPAMPTDRKGVKFRNVLFAQALTLNLNTRLSTNLMSLVLTNPVSGNRFCTMGALPGPDGKIGTSDDELDTKGSDGIELNGDEVKSYTFSSSVINTLKSDPTLGANMAGLIELVNRALAGQSTGSASLSDIAGAAGTINEAFDECRFLVPCQ